jgi:hypothetical protein
VVNLKRADENAETCRCWDKLCKNTLALEILQVLIEFKFKYIWNFLEYAEVTKSSDGVKYWGYV